ncbi:putative small GTPase [Trypanosoma vivax]|nr:putative small GTPase [Trypanosoma vivax]
MPPAPPAYKVVLLGEGRVGKTSLVSRFINDTFDQHQRSTTQASMYSSVNVPLLGGDRSVHFNIWDTAGQERFHALGPIYYRNADGALLVYDVTDADTLEKVRAWIRELRAVVGERIQLVVCGNKSDLEREREVDEERGAQFAKSLGAQHLSTSARTGMNVSEAFQTLATAIAGGAKGSTSGSTVYNSGLLGSGGGGLAEVNTGGFSGAPKRRRRRGLLRIEGEDGEGDEDLGRADLAAGGDGGGASLGLLSGVDYTCSTPSRRPNAPPTVDLRVCNANTNGGRPSSGGRGFSCCA